MKEDTLNLTNIKYFCDAVRLGGLSAAAKSNYVTQSAISQGITKLEKSLKVSLVAHHPNRFRLTPQGEIVFNQALDILKRAADFKQNLSQEDDAPYMGNLEFVCAHSFALAVLPQYLKRFRDEHPHVKVNFHLGKNALIKQMVNSGAVDFGILPDEGDLEKFEKTDIFSGNIRLYASKKIVPENRKDLGFILADPNSKESILFKNAYMRKFGKELTGFLEVTSWEMIAGLVAEGMGIGYFPDYIAHSREVQECDLGLDLQEYRISAISPPGMKLRKSSEIFLSYFLSDFCRIL
jgi:DNA-binding transcriptional LysR family regulator